MTVTRSARALVQKAAHGTGVFRHLHRYLRPGAVSVITYHAIVRDPLPVDDWCFLPLERFVEQMEYLRRHFRLMHLEEALSADWSTTDKPVACLTFDDGFASLCELALPVLERLGLPATVFLVTDLVDSSGTLWSARLHQALCQSSAVEVRFRERELPLGSPGERQRASVWLQDALKPLPPPDFERALDDVLGQLSARSLPPWEVFRILRSTEIERMGRHGLVRFGAHGATHRILGRLSSEEIQHEIHTSVASVRAMTDKPSRVFAYPNGRPEDFDERAIEALRQVGVDYAVTTIAGPNGPGTDPYRVRRYGVGSDDGLACFSGRIHHAREILGRVYFGRDRTDR